MVMDAAEDADLPTASAAANNERRRPKLAKTRHPIVRQQKHRRDIAGPSGAQPHDSSQRQLSQRGHRRDNRRDRRDSDFAEEVATTARAERERPQSSRRLVDAHSGDVGSTERSRPPTARLRRPHGEGAGGTAHDAVGPSSSTTPR